MHHGCLSQNDMWLSMVIMMVQVRVRVCTQCYVNKCHVGDAKGSPHSSIGDHILLLFPRVLSTVIVRTIAKNAADVSKNTQTRVHTHTRTHTQTHTHTNTRKTHTCTDTHTHRRTNIDQLIHAHKHTITLTRIRTHTHTHNHDETSSIYYTRYGNVTEGKM